MALRVVSDGSRSGAVSRVARHFVPQIELPPRYCGSAAMSV